MLEIWSGSSEILYSFSRLDFTFTRTGSPTLSVILFLLPWMEVIHPLKLVEVRGSGMEVGGSVVEAPWKLVEVAWK